MQPDVIQLSDRKSALVAKLNALQDADSIALMEEAVGLVYTKEPYVPPDRLAAALSKGHADMLAGRVMGEADFYSGFDEAVRKGLTAIIRTTSALP